MRLPILLLAALLSMVCGHGQEPAQPEYAGFFGPNTMRVDYFHSGTASEEHFAADRILNDGPWSGSRSVLLDELELGLYFFEVVDQASSSPIYSRGFASIFGEWQTIGEARRQWGTFHESIRFPWPLKPVTLVIYKRDAMNEFQRVWEMPIDPAERKVNPAPDKASHAVFTIRENGTPAEQVDIVMLGDGYTAAEMDKFRNDALRLSDELLAVEPFRSRAADISIRAVETPSAYIPPRAYHPAGWTRAETNRDS